MFWYNKLQARSTRPLPRPWSQAAFHGPWFPDWGTESSETSVTSWTLGGLVAPRGLSVWAFLCTELRSGCICEHVQMHTYFVYTCT